jgi:peptidoglycan/LPS O-acetylase OafA/YrhL
MVAPEAVQPMFTSSSAVISEENQKRNILNKLNSLQYLRAFSALGVIAYHIEGDVFKAWGANGAISIFSWGNIGVPLFFCLSGFVISYSGFHKPKKMSEFIQARLARIYPAYIFTALLFIFILLNAPSGALSGSWGNKIDGDLLLKTLFFGYGSPSGYVYVGWTLFYEMGFYLSFSTLSSRFHILAKKQAFYLLVAILLGVCIMTGRHRIADFLIGVVVFIVAVNPTQAKPFSPSILVLVISYILAVAYHPIGAFCGIILFAMIASEKQSLVPFTFKPILAIGNASYSIYLIQVISISAAIKTTRILFAKLPILANQILLQYILAGLLAMLITVIAGMFMHKFVEKPAYSLLTRKR